MPIPELRGQARKAVEHRGSHLQIIAAAGSGKTEVVSQRVVSLLDDGVPASGIVAFTFTERAAAELKERIAARVEERLGRAVLDQLGNLFVGTIHAYCFQLLQTVVPRYETYDVLDENQLNAFLAREGRLMGIKELDPDGKARLWRSIAAFLKGLDVVENELLEPAVLPEPFASILGEYLTRLERYRLLSFGQQIVRTVAELEKPEVRSLVHARLHHLIVDEYQDVNPAQERLIELLTGPTTQLCVVGDDDQAIYQWRGSDVSNIVDFQKRYAGVASYSIKKNRRSVPAIISVSNDFAKTITGRLPKSMQPDRAASATGAAVAIWSEDLEADEAGAIASAVIDVNAAGVPYRDIAVLVRSSAAYGKILDHFATFDIPVQPGGRTGLFEQPEAKVLARTLCWLVDHDWRNQYEWGGPVSDDDLLDEYEQAFDRPRRGRRALSEALHAWKAAAADERRTADLILELYELLDVLDVRAWDLDDPMQLNRLGTVARFSALLADFESVHRRARIDAANPTEQVGAQDRSIWFYKNLAIHVVNYAQGAYDGFDGEADAMLDAVDVTTIHRAKGLEWPAVLVPSLTKGRFPSGRTGRPQPWPIPRELFNASRYEGSDADERRLFYVAMTRARDWLSLSRHDRVNVKASSSSPYWQEVADAVGVVDSNAIELPDFHTRQQADDAELQLTFSDISSFLDCALAYRLRTMVGFQPRLAAELGYGKAVHHVLRMIAEDTKAKGKVPTAKQIEKLLDSNFFLPAANKAAHRQLKAAAHRLVTTYATKHAADLRRVWETERPFELHLDGITVSGRADVILDQEGGVSTALAIVDYKTSVSDLGAHDLQIQVYTEAGRREGLDMRGAYVHDLKAGTRTQVDITDTGLAAAEVTVLEAAARIRARDYTPSPGPRCRKCEVRAVCGSAKR